MASRQYFRGFVLLVILMRNSVLSQTVNTTDVPGNTTDPSINSTSAPDTINISCRQFTCNETACNTVFMNQTAVPCNANFSYCQLQRVAFMSYTASCSANCLATCVNQTQYGCSMDCCNTTDCLSATFQSLVPTVPPTAAPTTTSTTTTTTTVTSTTSGNNGKKCHKLTCSGEKCFMKEKEKTKVILCPVGQDYCQLKKKVTEVITWQASCNGDCQECCNATKASCNGDCRTDTACTSTSVDCTQECCNATKVASCLKLDGVIEHAQLRPPSQSPPAPPTLCWLLSCLAWLLGSHVTESRLLGLVERKHEHALFLFTHRRMAITGDDVTLDFIVPISHDFAIVEVSSPEELAVVGADTRVLVTDQGLQLELELRLPFGSHARFFLSEVNRAWSARGAKTAFLSQCAQETMETFGTVSEIRNNKKNVRNSKEVCTQPPSDVPASQFEWLSKYRKSSKSPGPSRQTSVSRGTHFSKLRKSGKMAVGNGKVRGAEEVKSDNRRGEPLTGENSTESGGKVKGEARDDLVRSSQHTVSNKAQMLAMPQFGLRDNLIRCEMLKNEALYTYIREYRFFLGTYNVNGQLPKESLLPWLGCTAEPPDIYCVGFQELDLSKEAFLFNETPKEQEWMKAVADGLHPGAKYALVKLVRLVGIMLLFYVKNEHAEHISDMDAETVGTGIMGRMGNKGAVAVRFRFYNSDICLVNSHLAAHVEEYERRNQDYRDICSRMAFSQVDPSLPPLSIMKHDAVLWVGDLNYRLYDIGVELVKDLIAEKDFQSLQRYDQLRKQMEVEAVFLGFVEGEISFQPTYKYDTGTDQWDTSEKCRVPAWCDRILWKGKRVKQLHYQSHMNLKTSDHKPVSSLLEIGIKVINEESYKTTFEDIVRTLDKMENECIPSVSLSNREFCFKDVKFMQHQAVTLTIHNDGQVPCQFEFIQKLDEPTYCKPWLTANPPKGFLAQGASLDIDLEVFVNRSTVTELNCGQQQMEDILVLHLELGKDYFISISGNYLPSCFGSSLQMLCILRDPIQDIPLDTLHDLLKTAMSTDEPGATTEEPPLEIPKEIWMMVDHLYRNASKQEDLFQQPGLRSEFEEIRDCLDTGMPESLPGSNHSVAEALLLFLDALPESVVPFPFYQQCLDSCSNSGLCKKVISQLPPCHRNVFDYLTAFLRELLRNSAHNHLDANILATIFAGLLLRAPMKQSLVEKRKAQEFFHHFLVQDP
ncbi:hypothetical protein SKAU_G00331630 [Synaphobranchus kaupii]|uniref:phosphoinositide 5-phosphatase n=1 Tax=Synaphobranchus kaupii TaxID=118154 RepID=A0A9Q1EL84_SYNKA|nr:hypothetical protein SKAU_G00331630 [Synaphobranchus kaupii]